MILRPGKKKLWLPSTGLYYKAGGGGGGGGATLTFVGQNVYTLAANPQTISGVSIGAASANRRVIIAMLQTRSGGPVTGITIGGVACTLNQADNNASYNGSITIGYADVPTGTTAAVVVTGGGAFGDEAQDVFYIYTVDKTTLVNPSPTFGFARTNATGDVTTMTANAATGANGFIITAVALYGFGSSTGYAVTAGSETYTSDGVDGASQNHSAISSKKSGSSANASSSVTWSWTNTAAAAIAVYAWN